MKFWILLAALCFFANSFVLAADKNQIRVKVKENLKEVNSCYKNALSLNPELEGKLILNWDINDKGEVANVTVDKAKTTLNNESVQACILEKVKTWKFPPAPLKQTISISYPFHFSRSK